MQNLVNTVKGTALGVADYLTPVLKESKFLETGVLTPEEFVAAGDHLVHHCPTWSWARGDASKARPFLPPDKQYLVTRNVPCYRRCKQMEPSEDLSLEVEEEDPAGGWVDTHHYGHSAGDKAQDDDRTCDMTLEPSSGGSGGVKQGEGEAADGSDGDSSEGEAEDMESFQESGLLDQIDPSTALSSQPQPPARSEPGEGAGEGEGEGEGGEIVRTRTYDLHITYDKYYQTPRLWLIGYDESRRPLSEGQLYEDISGEHARKTVTLEAHPHIGGGSPAASVHPCRHAALMRRLLASAAQGGRDLPVYAYLIVFLKFVQTVIPTIEYDFTMNFSI